MMRRIPCRRGSASPCPSDVLRNGPALVLGNGGHHGEDHLGGCVQRAEPFFLEAHLDALGAQLLDIDLTVYHIARKAGNTLYEDQVYLSLHRVRDHPHELRPLRRASGRDAAIGVDPDQHPFVVPLDVAPVIAHLRFEALLLALHIGADAAVSRHPLFAPLMDAGDVTDFHFLASPFTEIIGMGFGSFSRFCILRLGLSVPSAFRFR